MSQILNIFTKYPKDQHQPITWYLILDCQHWYHWTGKEAPAANEPFECPSCHPPMVISADGSR